MLKGHVFSHQLFGNPIFALFINTFTDGKNGVSNNYKNGMALSYSGSNVTIQSGAVCIQGRFLEEDASTTISAGTDTMFCKLVIEIDLDKTNTESDFLQGAYKVIKSASAYPTLTQTNIVKNNAGVYQYELARFKTTGSGITDFEDKRTFLDFASIYAAVETECQALISELQEDLADVIETAHQVTYSTCIPGIIYTPDNTRLGYYELYLKKIGNTIYVKCEIGVDANVGYIGSFINITDSFPDWAKPTANGDLLRQDQIHGTATATISGNRYLTPMTLVQVQLYKQINTFRLSIDYHTSSFSSTSSAEKFEFNGCYLAL